MHLQYHRARWWGFRWCNDPFEGAARTALDFINRVAAPNLALALNTGHADLAGESPAEIAEIAGKQLGMILFCSTASDQLGQEYDAHAPAAESGIDFAQLREVSGIPQVLDAVYPDENDEYLDCRAVWG